MVITIYRSMYLAWFGLALKCKSEFADSRNHTVLNLMVMYKMARPKNADNQVISEGRFSYLNTPYYVIRPSKLCKATYMGHTFIGKIWLSL